MQSKREQSAKHPPGNTSGVFLGTVQQKTNVGGQSACEKRGSRMQNGTPPSSVSISVICLGLASTGSASHPAESWNMFITATYGVAQPLYRDLCLTLSKGNGSRQQIVGSTLIQNQQDSSVTEVHKSWNCSAKTPSFLLFWLDWHPFPFIFCMLLTLPKPVIGIVLLSSLCNYSIQQMFWERATGVALPARITQMCLWHRSTEHSLIRACLLRVNPSPLCSVITPQQVDSQCVCMCWDCCLISPLATNQLVLLIGNKPSASGDLCLSLFILNKWKMAQCHSVAA